MPRAIVPLQSMLRVKLHISQFQNRLFYGGNIFVFIAVNSTRTTEEIGRWKLIGIADNDSLLGFTYDNLDRLTNPLTPGGRDGRR